MARLITADEARLISKANTGKGNPNRLLPSILSAIKKAAYRGEKKLEYQIPYNYRDLIEATVAALHVLDFGATSDRITYTDKIVIIVTW